ncbi:MAG: hypothetical protein K2M44_02065 [Clostridia bacterium]|nr:hypothetical protein [Clostridia bacterium]
MKRLFPLVLAVLLIALIATLCACTPKAYQIQEKLKKEGYMAQSFDYESAGVEQDKTSYVFSAVKGTTGGNGNYVYVIAFKSESDAVRYESRNKDSAVRQNLTRKGKLIVYGDAASVAILTD